MSIPAPTMMPSVAAPIVTGYTLRYYQAKGVEALLRGKGRSRLLVAPVGAGKTIIISELIRRLLPTARRILVLTHVGELVMQNVEKLRVHCAPEPVGILAGSLGHYDTGARILVANIASAYRHIAAVLAGGGIDAVIVDEAHRINPEGIQYGETLAAIQSSPDGCILYGLTGSPWRSGHGHICFPGPKGQRPIFGHLSYEISHGDLLDAGYIAPVRPRRTAERVSVEGVKLNSFGDYATAALDQRINTDEINARAMRELVAYAATSKRRRWLVFAVTIEHANNLSLELEKLGVSVGVVSAHTSAGERDRLVAAFRRGEITCLVNCTALGTGFDVAEVDLIGLLRPTRSRGLYYQMLGRGTRLAPGKKDCVVLDYAGSTLRIGRLEHIDWLTRERPPEGWTCDCGAINDVSDKVCHECGATKPKPPPGPKTITLSDTDVGLTHGAVITGAPIAWSASTFAWKGREHLRVIFDLEDDQTCSFVVWFTEDAPWQIESRERNWRNVGGTLPVPSTAQQALARFTAGECALPPVVEAVQNGPYWNVKRFPKPRERRSS